MSHEISNVAEAETLGTVEGNMCGSVMRDAVAPPGSKATSRPKGTRRNLRGRTAEAIERLDPDALAPESACGRVPVRGLLAVAKRRGMAIARLDLRNSGDTAGPRQRVVGYGSWALFEPDEGG